MHTTRLLLGDSDRGTIPDDLDHWLSTQNADQADLGGDGLGDVCDPDGAGDGPHSTAAQTRRRARLPERHEASEAAALV